ncbi:Cytochrome p450 [Mycena sanguinolenta]|uniref:Cytochrome p450 n=1 Tax=Mycena sanguinolenta TaxID=230812 RepID=A0A8H6YY69_9AGAR|nr:Cytochrome p450 [Mycena sanguinolenta]
MRLLTESSPFTPFNMSALLHHPLWLFSSLQMIGLGFTSWIFVLTIRTYINRRSLPPGPKGLPLVGNLLGVPKSQQWFTFLKLSRKYKSDIISVTLGMDTVIVLNSLSAVDALLEKKSSIYSDRYIRPHRSRCSMIVSDLIGILRSCDTVQDGKGKHRKVFMQQFRPSEVLLHRPVELEAARLLLQGLLVSPATYARHLRHMAGMVILSTAYGIDVLQDNDPYVGISEKATRAMSSTANRGFFLWILCHCLHYLPSTLSHKLTICSLKYVPEFFPGIGFKKAGARMVRGRKQDAGSAVRFRQESKGEDELHTNCWSPRLTLQ